MPAALLLCSLGVLAAGAWLVCPAGCGVPAPDVAGLDLAQRWRTPLLDGLFMAVTWLGSLWLLLPIALLLAWRWRQQARPAAWFVPLALLGSTLLAHAAKLLVNRPRPDLHPMLVDLPPDASYPSAHTMQITAIVLAWLLQPGTPLAGRPPWVALLLGLVVGLVAASRIHLQVHFPTDVLAGLGAAVCWVLALHRMAGRADRSGRLPEGSR
ncbi:MAG: hypothetical protein RLY71_3494 [Pseudomonadota bacterium]|jgi:undecaprenyl-diphosphatase